MNIQIQSYNLNFSAQKKYPIIPKIELMEYIRLDYTQKRISEIYQVPPHVVSRYMLTYGLASKHMDEEKVIENIKRMNRMGYSLQDIKEATGKTYKYIKNITNLKPEKDSTLDDIIKKLNLSDTDVKKYLK